MYPVDMVMKTLSSYECRCVMSGREPQLPKPSDDASSIASLPLAPPHTPLHTAMEETTQSCKSLLASAQRAYKSGEYTAALSCCKRALTTPEGKENALVHVTFAAIFVAQEEPELAERAFQSALKIDPENGQAWKGLSVLLEGYGRERVEELLPAYQKLAELTASGKLKGKASEWEQKLAALQKSLGLCDIKDEPEDDAEASRSWPRCRSRSASATSKMSPRTMRRPAEAGRAAEVARPLRHQR